MDRLEVEGRFSLPLWDKEFGELQLAFKSLAAMINYRDIEDRHKIIAIERLEDAFNWTLKGYEPEVDFEDGDIEADEVSEDQEY